MQTGILSELFVSVLTYNMDVPKRVGQFQELSKVRLVLTVLDSC